MTHPITYPFTTTTCSLEYHERNVLKKWEMKARVPEKLLLLEVDRHSNHADCTSFSKSVLGLIVLRDVPEKKRLRKAMSSDVTVKIELIKVEDNEADAVLSEKDT